MGLAAAKLLAAGRGAGEAKVEVRCVVGMQSLADTPGARGFFFTYYYYVATC